MTLIKFNSGNGLRNLPSFEGTLGVPLFFSDTLERLWSDEEVSWMPSVNIKEGAEDFKIDLAVPGMDKKDFSIEVENSILVVSGERKEEKNEEDDKHTRREFHYGSFKRSFSLPDAANPEKITAAYNNGILSLSVPKKEESKLKQKRQISIE